MNFASDNWAGVTEPVLAAIARHNGGFAPAYGGDDLTKSVTKRFCEVFETEVEVHFTATGTATNSIALASVARAGGVVFCTTEAHIHNDEFGATEFLTGGMKLVPLAHRAGLMEVDGLRAAIARYPEGGRFGQPVALSLTNATECGTVYPLDHAHALTDLARERNLVVHMDGARFGNAVAALGASPAEVTWKSGIDILSFGGTKNGCMAAEAIVVFSPDKVRDIGVIRQRAGHVVSKARFVAAQFEGYLLDDAWLKTAGHANAMAARLSAGLAKSNAARLGWQSTANEVFPILPKATIAKLRAAGAFLYEWQKESLPEAEWPNADEDLVRLVTSFATTEDDVDRFLSLI